MEAGDHDPGRGESHKDLPRVPNVESSADIGMPHAAGRAPSNTKEVTSASNSGASSSARPAALEQSKSSSAQSSEEPNSAKEFGRHERTPSTAQQTSETGSPSETGSLLARGFSDLQAVAGPSTEGSSESLPPQPSLDQEAYAAHQRTLQNRKAQKEFRQRRAQYLRTLEEKVRRYEDGESDAIARLRHGMRMLQDENVYLRGVVHRMQAPSEPQHMSIPLQGPASAPPPGVPAMTHSQYQAHSSLLAYARPGGQMASYIPSTQSLNIPSTQPPSQPYEGGPDRRHAHSRHAPAAQRTSRTPSPAAAMPAQLLPRWAATSAAYGPRQASRSDVPLDPQHAAPMAQHPRSATQHPDASWQAVNPSGFAAYPLNMPSQQQYIQQQQSMIHRQQMIPEHFVQPHTSTNSYSQPAGQMPAPVQIANPPVTQQTLHRAQQEMNRLQEPQQEVRSLHDAAQHTQFTHDTIPSPMHPALPPGKASAP
ncbi:uncharacterized protein L969DRAFT_16726 [Mixia osmundae IAM 14324]|nr:uncharacterized protein L969DRAFT_16726 [Mixia osmundae IAM 14324]KEI40052.1 hypothetical protein L969DRAFT_16726 [Mixia osmundae IAM 14324]